MTTSHRHICRLRRPGRIRTGPTRRAGLRILSQFRRSALRRRNEKSRTEFPRPIRAAAPPRNPRPVIFTRSDGAPRSRSGARRSAGGRLTQFPPPEEPTEFQRFVQQSTGRLLPIFGHDLFRQPPSTFAPADRVPVTPEYTVGPGDQLLIRGWGQIDLNVTPVVDRSGSVYIPKSASSTSPGCASPRYRTT